MQAITELSLCNGCFGGELHVTSGSKRSTFLQTILILDGDCISLCRAGATDQCVGVLDKEFHERFKNNQDGHTR